MLNKRELYYKIFIISVVLVSVVIFVLVTIATIIIFVAVES